MSDSMTMDDVLSALGEISKHFESCTKETYGSTREMFHRWMNAADWAAAYLNDTAPTMGGWISVKDRLPKNDNEVITAYKIDDEKAMKKRKGKLFVKTGNWTGYRWISVWDEYKCCAIEEEVLYWMPLPEPPEEDATSGNH